MREWLIMLCALIVACGDGTTGFGECTSPAGSASAENTSDAETERKTETEKDALPPYEPDIRGFAIDCPKAGDCGSDVTCTQYKASTSYRCGYACEETANPCEALERIVGKAGAKCYQGGKVIATLPSGEKGYCWY